ncbi:MAG: hypothetical protein ACI9CE_003361, partial [Flavobacterium sp.]
SSRQVVECHVSAILFQRENFQNLIRRHPPYPEEALYVYVYAHSFNNPQIIIIGFLALWLTISGLLLVKANFRRRDFTWRGAYASIPIS